MKDIGALVTTVVAFALLAWSLIYVFKYVGTAAQVDKDGKVVLDSFGNAKTILLAILPLATTAAGYWLGNKGVADAKAGQVAAEEQNKAVISAAGAKLAPGVDILAEARKANPSAFGIKQ